MAAMRHIVFGLVGGSLALSGNSDSEAQPWPNCVQKGQILRNDGKFGVFADIRPLGARKGCWDNNCGSTDKVRVPSFDLCAATCAKIPDCSYWTLLGDVCYFRNSDAGAEAAEEAFFAPRHCVPENTIFTVDVPFSQVIKFI